MDNPPAAPATDYDPELARQICDRLVSGELWRDIRKTEGMPSDGDYWAWRRARPAFEAAVRDALRAAAEARFEQALEVAMSSASDTLQADKLKVSTLLHHAERMDPERFGPPSARRKEGPGDAGGHIQTLVVRHFERALTEDGASYIRAIDSIQQVER
ncbi:hypothetical protein [Phenylobacterium sp.]|uniref:terminase small subunit-like protein n=1 Tax=Phenylobacterium sp. TaxID=1871053 RepID=UPI002CDDDF28|nr:hypothetical protein [Phenylobacterium sp.]HVI33813.1 hypothetical protein [Phenylobacterium sp.]